MAEIIAVVSTDETLSVTTQDSGLTAASTSLTNPAIVESLDSVGDVDVTTHGKIDGSVLVYRTTTNKWTSTTTLDAQNMEGGEF